MIKVELKELQANLDFYFKKLDQGEQIAVLENGNVVYELTEPFERESEQHQNFSRDGERVFYGPLGLLNPDEFSLTTPQEIADLFYNSTLPDPKGN